MGTQLSSILTSKEISIKELANKKLVIDAHNMLYQFLTTIRQRDGTPLMDSQGRITSHLSGLFFRLVKLIESDVKLAFVFDGKPPDLKKAERERRADIKKEAQRKYELAVEAKDIELMKKYASRTTVLTKEMIDESAELISAFGMPIIKAPSEGEAQAAHMVQKKDFFALVSQDTDGLLFGGPKIIKNLSITRRKKKPGTATHKTISPEIIDLSQNLNELGIDREQLIVIAMLCGTDFNIGGIKGIGPKKGLALIKKHNKNFSKLFKEAKWNNFFNYSWKKVYDLFLKMPTIDNYSLQWSNINPNKILDILVEHNFSKDRIEKSLDQITKKQNQTGLKEFF